MKSPTALAYLFGNPLSFLAILGATLFVGYESLTGQASGWLAIFLIAAFGFSLKCQNYLSSYGRWKREWDAMNGRGPKPAMFAGMPWLRYVIGIIAWVFGAGMALAAGNQPGMGWAGDVFWLVSLVGLMAIISRAFKHFRNRAYHFDKKISVTVCLLTPLHSVSAAKTHRSLPRYCVRLLN